MKSTFRNKVSRDARRQLLEEDFRLDYLQEQKFVKRSVDEHLKFIERKMAIGLITNSDFCEWATKNFELKFYQAHPISTIAKWAYEFYAQNDEAPHHAIDDIFRSEMNTFETDELQDLEEIIEGLATEYYEKPISTKYLIRLSEEYLNRQKVDHKLDLIIESDLQDRMTILDINPVENQNNLRVRDIDDYADLELPQILLYPWLREGEYTIVYADKGVGKTMFAVFISYMLACKNYAESKLEIPVGDSPDTLWKVKQPAKTLYVAGEMAKGVMDRFAGFKWMGEYIEEYKPKIIDRGDQQRESNERFSLSSRKTQKAILEYLKQNSEIKLIVLDNVQTLFDLEDSNRESEWSNKINPLLTDLEESGVACLILDHTGKDASRGAMGTHAKITRASYAINLNDHPDKNSKNDGQAWFKVTPQYARYPEGSFKPFYLRFRKDSKDVRWEVTDNKRVEQSENTNQIIVDLASGMKQAGIAKKYGLSPGRISQIKKQAEQDGLFKNGKSTFKIFEMQSEWDDE